MITKAEIQLVKSLKNKHDRTEHRLFVAEGDKLIAELLGSTLCIKQIYACSDSAHTTLVGALAVTRSEMDRLSHLKTPTSSLALVQLPNPETTPQPDTLKLVLDGVQDPGNIGTIIRIADWFGVRQIYCSPDCADCYAPKTVQATMGAIARVAVSYTNLTTLLADAQTPVYGTFLTNADNIYQTDNLRNTGFLVLGSEGRGISPDIEKAVTHRLYIPPFPAELPTVESLNVAVATAIAVAEFRRQVTAR